MSCPPPKPRAEIHVVGAAIVREGRCLVAKRSPAMALPGRWEFPGGKVDAGESAAAALRREIREELALQVEVGARLGVGYDEQGARRIRLEVFLCRWLAGELALAEHEEARWIAAAEIDTLDWAAADRPVLPALRAVLSL